MILVWCVTHTTNGVKLQTCEAAAVNQACDLDVVSHSHYQLVCADGQQSKHKAVQIRKRSEAHNRAIAVAIKKKWASPEYRDKILDGMRADSTQHQRMSAYKVTALFTLPDKPLHQHI